MLVIAIEGTSLKALLPEIRWGSTLPFYFQILDYTGAPYNAWRIRQRNIVQLTFSEDANSCTLPSTECVSEFELEEDGAASMWITAAASFALISASLL